jgi:hypothetical protein
VTSLNRTPLSERSRVEYRVVMVRGSGDDASRQVAHVDDARAAWDLITHWMHEFPGAKIDAEKRVQTPWKVADVIPF